MYSKITFNLAGASKRYEILDGEQYLVVPTVAITPGVHAGSEGPLLYLEEELSRNPITWNYKPAVVYHPQANGQDAPITACDPGVIERQGVGNIFNSTYDGKSKMEVWFKESKLRKVDSRVLDAINNGEMVEVSTGLYHDLEPKAGVFNGESYRGIVRNIQPDHLAILPDRVGACSIAKGAGLLRNADGGTLSFDDIREQVRGLLRANKNAGLCSDYCYVSDVYPKYAIYESDEKCYKISYKIRAGKVALEGQPEEVTKVTSYVTANGQSRALTNQRAYVTMNGQIIANDEEHQGPVKAPTLPQPTERELSDPMRRQQASAALKAKYSGVQQEGDWGGWVTDLYANYVVYSHDGKHFRLPYTYDDDKIRFDGEPEEVERVSSYRAKTLTPIDGTQSPYPSVNQEPSMATTVTKQHTDTIARLQALAAAGKLTVNAIHEGAHHLLHDGGGAADAHHAPGTGDGQVRTTAAGARSEEVNKMIAGGHAKEEDRKFLEGLPDDHFASVHKWVSRGATSPIQPYSYEGIGDRSAVHSPAAQNKAATVNEYISQAPPEVREMLMNGLAAAQAEKEALIRVITTNRGNVFNPAWLALRPLPELKGLAALAGGGPSAPQRSVSNYGGQADVPMYLDAAALTTNAGSGEEPQALPIRGVFNEIEEGAQNQRRTG